MEKKYYPKSRWTRKVGDKPLEEEEEEEDTSKKDKIKEKVIE